MGNMGLGPMLPAPGRERPDYTVFKFPAATLVDGSAEEVEVDQALSLQGRRGRDFLGVAGIDGLFAALAEEHLTIGSAADHSQSFSFRLATRTGAFVVSDPELIWVWRVTSDHAIDLGATDTANTISRLDPMSDGGNWGLGEPFLYVAPRLFWRFQNDGDQSIAADEFAVRWGSISVNLSFEIFIELLERFADVTLL
ncbi:MAG: hypothetical protein V3U45_07975 [bacterium]